MQTPLLVTKLHVPRPRTEMVSRPRLVARLDAGLDRRLTLISAPPGFGKTTLVSEWIATNSRSVAWVSLDEGDGDVARFLAYLIAAVQTVTPDLGHTAAVGLQSPSLPADLVLATLINELAAQPDPLVIVLDDYHRVDSPEVDTALAFLLDHLPAPIHLVITTREDPRLPLSRLRASRQVSELRVADLRFTTPEAEAFLNQVMDLRLSPGDVGVLETRTEGWIAGLQLAALSMQGRTDVAGFIQHFAGGDRYIVDYLVEEVLQRQTEIVREFLLHTSVLDRLHVSLCDAVTGRTDSRTLLAELDRGNLFLVSLDDDRQWFRYHHLFADVLRMHAADLPGGTVVLHQRASEWFAHHGLLAEAIRHADAAGDLERMADLIELSATSFRRTRQEALLLGWLRTLPADLVRTRPVLCVTYAGVLLSCGELDGVETYIRHGEEWLAATAGDRTSLPLTDMVVVDEEEFSRLASWIAMYRSGLSLVQGDLAATVHFGQQALDLSAADDHLSRGAGAALLGLALWTSGELDSAYRTYRDGMESLRKAGNIADTIGGVIGLADILITQGRLHDAMRLYQQALQGVSGQGRGVLRGTADMYVGMAELCLAWGDLDTANQHLASSLALGEAVGFPQHRYRLRVAMALVSEAQGDLPRAGALLDEAERLYASDFYPNVRPIAAIRARGWIAQGRLGEARQWARERNLGPGDDLSYLREYEHITLARLMLAELRGEREEAVLQSALGLLERLAVAAESGARIGNLIEVLVVQALALAEDQDRPRALATLARALELGEPEGYVRLFTSEGTPMATLLAELRATGTDSANAERLLTRFPASELPAGIAPGRPPARAESPLSEPLTARELEVLRLIAQGLSNQQIGERLYLALSTVKGYNREIFGKLGASRRTEAVARATELGLL